MVQAFRRGSQTVLSLVPELEARLRARRRRRLCAVQRPARARAAAVRGGPAAAWCAAAAVRRAAHTPRAAGRRRRRARRGPRGAPALLRAARRQGECARVRRVGPRLPVESRRALRRRRLRLSRRGGRREARAARGTLLTFSSGAENLHSVAPVEWGCRVAAVLVHDRRALRDRRPRRRAAGAPPAAWSLLDGESALPAAITTLASNDGARARLLAAHARGTPGRCASSPRWATRAPAARRPPPGARRDRHGGGGGGGRGARRRRW